MHSKETSIKGKLSCIASESNVHGISRIVSDRPMYLRFLWLFAFFGLFGVGIYQVTSIFVNFFQYPTKTTVMIKFNPLPLPAITICNMNIIKKSKLDLVESKLLRNIVKVS